MPKDKPHCKKCGNYHWGYTPCEKGTPVRRVNNLPDGWRVVGNRTHTYHETSPGVFQLNKKHKKTGTVTPPPEAA